MRTQVGLMMMQQILGAMDNRKQFSRPKTGVCFGSSVSFGSQYGYDALCFLRTAGWGPFVSRIMLILLAWSLTYLGSAYAAEWMIDDGRTPVAPLSHHQSILRDPEGTMTWRDAFARRNEFDRPLESTPVFGFTKHTIWSCMRIRSESDRTENLLTRLGTTRLEHVTWYLVDNNGRLIKSKKTGLAENPRARERFPSLQWPLPPGEERWLFLQVRSDTSIWLPIRGGDVKAMQEHEWQQVLVDSLVMGFCGAIGILVLVIALIQQQKVYRLFSIVIFCYVIYFATFNGYTAMLHSHLPVWFLREFMGITICLMLITFARFNEFFSREKSHLKLVKWLQIGAMSFPLLGISSLIFMPFFLAIQITHLCAIASLLLAMIMAFCFGGAMSEHRWYALVWGLLAIMMIFFALQFGGIIPMLVSFRKLQLMSAPSLLIGFLIASLLRQESRSQSHQRRMAEKRAYELVSHIAAGTYEAQLIEQSDGSMRSSFLFTSPQFRQMFELSQEELDQNPLAMEQRIHQDDRESWQIAQASALRLHQSLRWEGRLRRSGQIRWFQIAAEPRCNHLGQWVWSGVVTDVTSQKNAQEALRHTLENLPVAIACDDTSDPPKIVMINEQFVKTFGYTTYDIPTVVEWSQRAYPDEKYRQEVMTWWFQAVEKARKQQGKIESRELTIRCKDGSDKEVIISTTMLEQGPVLAFLDVTDRNRAARAMEALRTSREKSAYELTENMPAGTYALLLRMNANQEMTMQFRFFSRRFLDFFQVTREQIQKDPNALIEALHPDDRASMLAANQNAYDTSLPFYWEGRTLIDGKIRWINVRSNPRIDHSGAIVWEGVVNDITAYIEAERKLEESLLNEKRAREEAEKLRRDAERAHEAKSLFLAKMSHEIRTPLSALVSLSQAMWMRGEQQAVDSDFTPFLNRVRSGGQYLNLILRNVLNISAAESGRVPVKAEEFYVADWVTDVQNILEPIAEYYRGRLHWVLPDDDEARWCTDQMRLTQIVLNLCENALKYSIGATAPVCIRIALDADHLLVEVSDQGPGIPREHQSSLFTAFSQLDQKISPLDEGVGLGLTIVKINTELLQGKVSMENGAPRGMKFIVRIPRMSTFDI